MNDDDELPEMPNDETSPYLSDRPITLDAEQTAAFRRMQRQSVTDNAPYAKRRGFTEMNGYYVKPVVYLKVYDTESESYHWELNEYDPPLYDDDGPEYVPEETEAEYNARLGIKP